MLREEERKQNGIRSNKRKAKQKKDNKKEKKFHLKLEEMTERFKVVDCKSIEKFSS